MRAHAGALDELDVRAERPHPGTLPRGDIRGDERVHGGAARSGRVGQALAEVAGRGAHPGLSRIELLGEQPCPAPLEAPDRGLGLVLDDDLPSEGAGECVAHALGGVQKRRIDPVNGARDPRERDIDGIVAFHQRTPDGVTPRSLARLSRHPGAKP